MIFALAGNQNCGKTTLFNQLTGSNQHVGNFPGVTVERKEGVIRGHAELTVVDLPGIYSLSPYTPEEIVSRDFLLQEKPDGIINIVDATNIERNLYLSLQLLELGIPMVIALNMMDEVRANHGAIDVARLSDALGVPCIPISAVKNEGTEEVVRAIEQAARKKQAPKRLDFCTGPVHQAIHALAHLVEDHAAAAGMSPRFAASKLVEGDEPTMAALRLNENEQDIVGHIVHEMEQERGLDREAAMADMRYTYIEGICQTAVVKPQVSREQLRSRKVDAVLLGRYTAFPIFAGILALVFFLTFGPVGQGLSNLMANAIHGLSDLVNGALVYAEVNPLLRSLVVDGIFAGVGTVLSFLPTIVLLFFLLSILEDSGYMARVAFLMDKPLRRFGLSGRSFVPMLIGFGCSVPGILATRTLASERDRRMTAMLVPFLSCNAKLPIYAVFASAFFPHRKALAIVSLYLLGVLLAAASACVLGKTAFRGNPVPFVLELPAYRLPSAKSVCIHLWEKAKDFITRAFSLILVASVVVWVLQTFDFRFFPVEQAQDSMLAYIGGALSPVFAPLGFGCWQAVAALLPGLSAKETVVSTLTILTGAEGDAALAGSLAGLFSPLSAASYLVFVLLYTPCMAAVSALRQELNSRRLTLAIIAFELCLAWAVSFLVFQGGRLLGLS